MKVEHPAAKASVIFKITGLNHHQLGRLHDFVKTKYRKVLANPNKGDPEKTVKEEPWFQILTSEYSSDHGTYKVEVKISPLPSAIELGHGHKFEFATLRLLEGLFKTINMFPDIDAPAYLEPSQEEKTSIAELADKCPKWHVT